MPNEHPFAGKWNHNSRHYPTIGDLVDGCRVVLDVGCGDGTLAHYLARRGHQVIGIDLDPALLPPDSEDVHFMMGDATGLQFADDSFDAVVSVMLLHQTRLELALLREMRRVTRPGGRLVVCEFSTPVFPPFRTVYEEYLMKALPAIARRVSSNSSAYEYLAESIAAWPDQRGLAEVIMDAGWQDVAWRNVSGGIVALHRGVA